MNVNNPELEDYLYNVAAYWVREYDIDGYRCDVASGIDDRNPVFWQEMRRRLKKLKPELFLLGESAADNIMSGFTLNIFNHKFDAAYDWELRGFGTGALNNLFKGTSNTAVLSSVIPKIYGTNDYAMRFVENHDFLRATSEFGLKQSKLAHTVVFTIGGVPLIYGGGEVGELSQLNQINWNDPNNFKPYFAKLLDIRKKYIKNDAQVTTLSNSNSAMVETYITKSDTSTLLTVANFAGSSASLTINFGNNIQDSSVYVYDLFQDTSLFVTSSQLNSLTFNLSGSEAKVYRLQNYNITSVSGDPGLVYKYQLDQNYPNPFNPSTIISYSIAESEIVKVAVYDILGREVATLVNQSQNAGSYKVNWNGKNKSGQSVTSGIYLYTIKAGNYNSAKKMILMK
jgi:hypothetical protein